MTMKQISVVTVLTLLFTPSQAAIGYIDAFAYIQDGVVWPTPNSNQSNVSSTFGPRIRGSCNCDDFHRGVDIHGEIGDPILASYGGEVVKVATYSSGGKTVIIEHAFDKWVTFVPGLGNTKRWYTLYLHMNDWDVEKGDIVDAGDVIGELGESGSTLSPHLHHEVRVGTRCSLEWAVGHPSSTCNTKGYDPHVSPFLVYPDMITTDITASTTQIMDGSNDGVLRASTPDAIPNVNIYTVDVVNMLTGNIVQSHTLDLNLRIGYDATSTSALDTFDKSMPYLAPISFGYTAIQWEIDLVVPLGWIASKSADEEVVATVTDIWGVDQPPVVLADGSVTW